MEIEEEMEICISVMLEIEAVFSSKRSIVSRLFAPSNYIFVFFSSYISSLQQRYLF